MATTTGRAPLLFCLVLCLCCCAPRLCAEVVAGSGGGYAVRAVTVDKGGARLRAELAAVAAADGGGGVHAAYGDDLRNLDVYARCDYNERSILFDI